MQMTRLDVYIRSQETDIKRTRRGKHKNNSCWDVRHKRIRSLARTSAKRSHIRAARRGTALKTLNLRAECGALLIYVVYTYTRARTFTGYRAVHRAVSRTAFQYKGLFNRRGPFAASERGNDLAPHPVLKRQALIFSRLVVSVVVGVASIPVPRKCYAHPPSSFCFLLSSFSIPHSTLFGVLFWPVLRSLLSLSREVKL